MMELEKIKNIYKDIFKILEKYKDDVIFDIKRLEEKAIIHIFGVELKEKYGLNVNPKDVYSIEKIRFGEYKRIWSLNYVKNTIFKDLYYKMKIENGSGYVFILEFYTGAFMFSYDGKEYPIEFFQKFWEELKKYNPDYEDCMNHKLCWKLENAKEIFNSFENLLNKYYELNKKRIKEEKIKNLKMELDNLQKD